MRLPWLGGIFTNAAHGGTFTNGNVVGRAPAKSEIKPLMSPGSAHNAGHLGSLCLDL